MKKLRIQGFGPLIVIQGCKVITSHPPNIDKNNDKMALGLGEHFSDSAGVSGLTCVVYGSGFRVAGLGLFFARGLL